MALVKAVQHTLDIIIKSNSVFQMYVVLDKNCHMMAYASIVKNIRELRAMDIDVAQTSVKSGKNYCLMVLVENVKITLVSCQK